MLGFFRKKEKSKVVISAPVQGKPVSLSQVNDPTFSEEMLGKGMAIIPEVGEIYAPADGEISLMFDTFHAVSMTTDEGVEILIHVGLDTVNRNGHGFKNHVFTGEKVKKGDLLLSVDLETLKEEGYDMITPVVICNTDEFKEVTGVKVEQVKVGDDLILIQTK